MARVTVEDCLEHVENRFKLVLLASKRTRQLVLGAEALVEWENDKPTVVALREIAENLVNEETMQASLATPEEGEGTEFGEDELAALYSEISRELNQVVPDNGSKPEGPPATEKPVSFLFREDFSRAGEEAEAPAAVEDAQPKPAPDAGPPAGSLNSGWQFLGQPEKAPDADSAPPPPETDSSSEGEQGF